MLRESLIRRAELDVPASTTGPWGHDSMAHSGLLDRLWCMARSQAREVRMAAPEFDSAEPEPIPDDNLDRNWGA